MKKKHGMCVALLIIISTVYANETYDRYFSYHGIGSGYDPLTGNMEVAPGHFKNLHNREKLKEVEITWLQYRKGKENQFIHQEYLEGLITSEYLEYYEKEFTIYEYDSSRRLIREGDLWTYKYFEDIPNKQEAYNSNKLSWVYIITLLRDGYEIESSHDDVSHKSRTIMENGVITKIVESRDGTERCWYDFTYENRLLKKILCARVNKSDVRQVTTINEYQGTNISELEVINYRQGRIDFIDTYYFKEYDSNGNWHICEQYQDGKLIAKVERNIQYIE